MPDTPDYTRRSVVTVTNPEGQALFDIGFPVERIVDNENIEVSPVAVYRNGDQVTGFSWNVSAGTVLLSGAAEEGDIITIDGVTPLDPGEDYPLRGGLSTHLLNKSKSSIVWMIRELRRDLNRVLQLNKAEGSLSAILPFRVQGRALIWGPDGITNSQSDISDLDGAILQASTSAQVALDAAASAGVVLGDTQAAKTQAEQARDAAQAAAAGMKWRPPVLVATTEDIALSGVQTIDGIVAVSGQRVLVRAQDDEAENGIYIVDASVWMRSVDADSWSKLVAQAVIVERGNTYEDQAFICTVDQGGEIDVDNILWSSFNPPLEDGAVSWGKLNVDLKADEDDIAAGEEEKIPSAKAVRDYVAAASALETDWLPYTPTITGLTASNVSFVSRRKGKMLQIRGKFTSGAPAATPLQITYGYDGVNGGLVLDGDAMPSGDSIAGVAAMTTPGHSPTVLVNPSNAYFSFGYGPTQTPTNINGVLPNGTVASFFLEVPIQGW